MEIGIHFSFHDTIYLLIQRDETYRKSKGIFLLIFFAFLLRKSNQNAISRTITPTLRLLVNPGSSS